MEEVVVDVAGGHEPVVLKRPLMNRRLCARFRRRGGRKVRETLMAVLEIGGRGWVEILRQRHGKGLSPLGCKMPRTRSLPCSNEQCNNKHPRR